MEEESVRDALFFKALLSPAHRPTLLAAAAAGSFVCVPQSCSLSRLAVTRADVLHHVLTAAGGGAGRGEFRTLSGRRVVMSGTEARAEDGFPARVVARVLSAQSIPVDVPDGKGGRAPAKLHVYHLSRPLDGGIAAPSSVDDMSPAAVAGYAGLLRGLPETEEAFAAFDAAVAGAAAALAARDAPPDARAALAAARVRAACDAAGGELLECSLFDGEPRERLDVAARQVQVVLECAAGRALHGAFIRALRDARAGRLAELDAALAARAGDGIEAFEVGRKFRCDYEPVVDALVAVGAAPTPLGKLHALRDAAGLVVRVVEAALDAAGVDLSDVDLGADDVLAILTWVIARAAARGPLGPGLPTAGADLVTQLAYIQRARVGGPGALDKSQLGYVFANWGQALGYFGATAGPDEMW